MNRRDLLRRAFAVGAAGLMLPVVEPVRKTWALDRTMIPRGPAVGEMYISTANDHLYVYEGSAWFDATMIRDADDNWVLLPTRPDSMLRMYNFSEG